ncbi:taste receptor type 1 member 3-like [Sinocyclocheilus rhinocerous]|uniref:taste receptor type 1 member 3-like n=1 Tax=Sinocyclocheilus rhinocerous TaxID=307959 RepID=UPI0007B87C6A|nr:PREDICTED: taste receptor type 1 member 3-like [Sinocyclocheilus rhinocerous]
MAKEWTLLVLCGILGSGLSAKPSWFKNISADLFKSPGDILVGGLFPINELTSDLSKRVKPDDLECNRISTYGLSLTLAMKFSLDEINSKENLLPGITLGFESYDTCMQPAVVMRPVLQLLTKESTEELDVTCNYTDYKPRVIAIIGPSNSELVPVIGKLIGFFLIPLISYGATSDMFSDKETFPSFMRTVPSDRWQVVAIVQLLKQFGWNWVSVVGSDDEYGQKGQQQFSSMANEESICVAYQGLIPVYSDPVQAVNEILNRIVDAKVGVVVVFSLSNPARNFFIEVIKRNMTGVWVASTAWALNELVSTLPGINSIGTVLAFADITRPLDLFTPYIRELFTKMEGTQIPQQPDTEISPLDNPCTRCSYLSQANVSMVEIKLVQRSVFSVYTAVYCVAHALHDLLGCNATHCALNPKTDNVYPWQLLRSLQKVSVDLEGVNFKFDKEGNPSFGYDVMQWNFNDTTVLFDVIGYFYQNLTINENNITWHTKNGKVPMSIYPLNAFFPTVALSVILTISLQIVCITEFPEKSSDQLENIRGRGSLFVILGCCGVQAGLCGWYAQEAPSLTKYVASLEVTYVKTFLRCPVEPMLNFGLMLGFNVMLALVSFMATFMALKPPGQYNLARDITISSLSYCVMWVMFIPIYTSLNDKDKSIAQVGISLLSNIGLVAAYFFPKCQLLVKHPELNTDDHFRTFLEGVPPTPPEES